MPRVTVLDVGKYRLWSSRYSMSCCILGLKMPLKITIIERENPVAVISISGVKLVPQSQVGPSFIFWALLIRNFEMMIAKKVMTRKKTKNMGAETELKPCCTVMLCPGDNERKEGVVENTVRFFETLSRSFIMDPEYTPNNRQRMAIAPMPSFKDEDDSLALMTSLLLGRAKNVTPKAFTKQASAKPPVKASEPLASIKIHLAYDDKVDIPKNSDWNVSHSLKKPLKGGRADIAIDPTRKNKAVWGIYLIR